MTAEIVVDLGLPAAFVLALATGQPLTGRPVIWLYETPDGRRIDLSDGRGDLPV